MDRKRNTKARGRKTLRQKTFKNVTSERDGDRDCVNLSRWLVQPPRVIVKLSYRAAGLLYDNALTSTSKSWNCNGVYDVDPTLGSTATAGFTEWSSLYRVNQVLKTRVIGSISSASTTNSIEIAHGFVPQVIAAGAFTPDKYRNKDIKPSILLGYANGSSTHKFTDSILMENLFDRDSYRGDLTQFRGTSASNPSTLGNYVLGITSSNGAALTQGVSYVLDFDFWIEFSFPTVLTV